METKVTSPAVKGMIISLALIGFAVVVTIMQQDTNKALGFIPMAMMLGGIVWACLSYSKQMNGNVTFGNVFSHGFKTTALVAAVMGLWVALSLSLIFPESLDRAMDMQREALEQKGGMSDADIDKYMTMGRKMALPMGTIVTVILYLVVGAISALLGASVAKKNPNPVFPE
jgi:hypothetical protein